MEGIADGLSVDHCHYCLLIDPNEDACTRCNKRMRYLPAGMIDPKQSQSLANCFLKNPNDENATQLATQLWLLKTKGFAMPSDAPKILDKLREWFQENAS